MRRLLLAVLSLIGCASPRSTPDDIANAKDFVAKNQGGFLTRLSCDRHEAALRMNGWQSLNEREKRGVTVTLAIACEAETGRKEVTILDSQSGKTLAEYDGLSYTVH